MEFSRYQQERLFAFAKGLREVADEIESGRLNPGRGRIRSVWRKAHGPVCAFGHALDRSKLLNETRATNYNASAVEEFLGISTLHNQIYDDCSIVAEFNDDLDDEPRREHLPGIMRRLARKTGLWANGFDLDKVRFAEE